MQRDELVRKVEEHYHSFWKGDVDDFDRQLSPDFVDEEAPPGSPPGPEPVKFMATMARAAFDVDVTVEDAVVEGNMVAVRARWHGTHIGEYMGRPATGNTVDMQGMVFWRFDDQGLIDRRWAVVDMSAFARATET